MAKMDTKLRELIDEGAYHADQVFNADETGLYWKKMPSRTYLAAAERTASGFKAAKDRITLLFCSNASGELMLKPLLLHRAKRPRSMQKEDFDKLPVYWMNNPKAWVTQQIFKDWFEMHFIPDVKKYLEEKGLEFKVLLLLDNAPGHLKLDHPNVRVEFLPPNTTSLIQPQDQGIISNFKKLYIKQTFKHILDETEKDDSMTVTTAWKNFTMRECVRFIGTALNLMKPSTLNACWKPLWPECVRGKTPKDFDDRELILLAHAVGGKGFDDFSSEDVNELLEDSIMTDNDLRECLENDGVTDNETGELDQEQLEKGIAMCEAAVDHFIRIDPNAARAISFKNDIEYCIARYQEELKVLRNSQPAVQADPVQSEDSDDDEACSKKKRRCRVIYSDSE
ncbi:tigger transposable element-derived protein 1-like [Aedes albopictus]|uniref:DDE-1 domain-containing protein n=1 Tax=Aedes albopictus TaxID=7160 RepID=A0ABM1YPH0_AEDAL